MSAELIFAITYMNYVNVACATVQESLYLYNQYNGGWHYFCEYKSHMWSDDFLYFQSKLSINILGRAQLRQI